MRNSEVTKEHFDTACATSAVPLPHGHEHAYQIVRLEPYVSSFARADGASVSIVHHMDLFVCDERIVRLVAAALGADALAIRALARCSHECYALYMKGHAAEARGLTLRASSFFFPKGMRHFDQVAHE